MGNEVSVVKNSEQSASLVAADPIKSNEKLELKYEPISSSDVIHFRNLVEGKSGKGKFQNGVKAAAPSKWDTSTNRLSADALKDQTKATFVEGFSVFGEEESIANEIRPDGSWPNKGLAAIEKGENSVKSSPVVPGDAGVVEGKGESEVISDGRIPVFREEESIANEILPDGSWPNKGLAAIEKGENSVKSSPVVPGNTGAVEGESEAISDGRIPVFREEESIANEILPDGSWPNKGLAAIEKRGNSTESSPVAPGATGAVEGGDEFEAIPDGEIPVFNEEELAGGAVQPDRLRRGEGSAVDLRETSAPGERVSENTEEVVLLRDEDVPDVRMTQESVAHAAVSPGEQVLGRIERVSDPVPTSQISAQRTVVEIGNVVAQRILVHEASGAKSEVLVQLRETVLPGTEIALLREGTSLRVDFFSRVGESAMFLSQHHGALREYLTQRLESIKEVKVNVYDHSENRSGDAFGQGQNRRHQREHTSDEEYLR